MNEPTPQSGGTRYRSCLLCGYNSQTCAHAEDNRIADKEMEEWIKSPPSPTVTEKVSLDRRKTLKEELKRHDRRLFYQADDHTYWDTERLRVVLRFRDKIHQKHREELEREKGELVEALGDFISLTEESGGVSGYHLNGNMAEWDYFDFINEAKLLLQKHQSRDNFQSR